MTALSREQLALLSETTLRRALRPDEAAALSDGLATLFAAVDRLEKRDAEQAATIRDHEHTILSQRAEILAAQKVSTR